MSIIDYNKQSFVVPGTERNGQTGHYRNAFLPDGQIKTSPKPGFTRLYDIFQHTLKKFRNRECLGIRQFDEKTRNYGDYLWQTYEQVNERITNFGSGILHLKLNIIKDDQIEKLIVGICSANRPEYHIVYQSASAYNFTVCPLYESLGPNNLEYCLTHTEASIVIVAKSHVQYMLNLSGKLPALKAIITLDSLDDPACKFLQSEASQKNILLYEFSQIEKFGQQHFRENVSVHSDDLFIIMYTSGTTGLPKGVMLSHGNLLAAMCPVYHPFDEAPGSRVLSYLPMAHIFGVMTESIAIMSGISIGYSSGDSNRLFEDIQTLQPIAFSGVPRIFNKLYKSIRTVTIDAPGKEGEIARRAYQKKLAHFKKTGELKYEEWDKLAGKNIRGILGKNIKRMFCSAAALSEDVMEFLKIALGVNFVQGYGQTESTGAGSRIIMGDPIILSHVGAPSPCVEIKLVDVPSLNYYSTDKPNPRGEICLIGASIMKGYFKDEKKTKETIDKEGWLRTGDVGEIDGRGCLKIIDRVKNIFKLAQGEYVAPEKIENIYLQESLISQIFVHGDPNQRFLVAIIVPYDKHFIPWASQIVKGLDYEALMKNNVIINEFLKRLHTLGKINGLNGFEQVKAIHLDTISFSIENGLLTPTMKVKRREVEQHYKKIFDKLYKNLANKSNL
ncbi:acetyl-CoA synthetase-like protein [Gigaspora margarita]|uniref:Acetyl-CoA synthetase-like protein n=2 Tax=Gigaspora margarita TaxID=4874 RepID=A0A8H3XJT9_GIGMA|nr:acetyl-CoA synthetase-like protein [Gigaspora margarita]